MRLEYDFSELWTVVKRIGAQAQPFHLTRSSNIEQIALELIKGVEIKLDELGHAPSGLLSYQGMQVLLYIPDQGNTIAAVLDGNRAAGRRFHVAHCETLVEMKRKNRFERYIATRETSGSFEVQGFDPIQKKDRSGLALLHVCQNCLNKLNYKFARTNRSAAAVRDKFNLREFFETYSSCFEYLPSRTTLRKGESSYSVDWADISKKFRADCGWRCQECSVTLEHYRHLLHVHHVDGVKSNNRPANLQVLCKACHRRQPLHDGIYVPLDEMKLINQNRRKQGLLRRDWTTTLAYADPALYGLLGLIRQQRKAPPEIEYQLEDVALDLAWPERRYGIVIGPAVPAIPASWTVHNLTDAYVGIDTAL
jgi:5-methylcytosine-specific restriction endonuclease McrA